MTGPDRVRAGLAAAGRRVDLAVTVGVLVAGIALFAFAALTEDVLDGDELTGPDHAVLDWLVAHRTGRLTALLRLGTGLGSTAVLPVLGLLAAGTAVGLSRSWRPVAFLATVGAGSSLLTVTAKALVGRPRPPAAVALVGVRGDAFPSGHALNTATVVGASAVVFWAYRRVRIWTTAVAAVIILLVGVSRLYLGVHWLTDVLAAYALGLAWVAAVATAFHLFRPEPDGPPRYDPGLPREDSHRVARDR